MSFVLTPCLTHEEFVEKPRFLKKEARILFSSIKEWNNDICNNINGPKSDPTKWSKSERERQVSYDITYMWNSKNVTGELIYKTETYSDTENKLMVNKWERKGEG